MSDQDGLISPDEHPATSPTPFSDYKMEPDAATLAAAEAEARSPKEWPDPPAPNPDAPQGDPNVRFNFINPTTGEVTENLTTEEVFELEAKWRADYGAQIQAKIEADNAAFVPESYEEEELPGLRVYAIDAGVSTGYVCAELPRDGKGTWGDEKILGYGQFKAESYRDTASRLIEQYNTWQPDVVVVEQFDLRPQNNFVADLTPVKVNAVLGYYLPQIVWQTPAQAKSVITDKHLKALSFWPTGKDVNEPDADDVRDSARHLYYYLIKTLRNYDVAARMVPRPKPESDNEKENA